MAEYESEKQRGSMNYRPRKSAGIENWQMRSNRITIFETLIWMTAISANFAITYSLGERAIFIAFYACFLAVTWRLSSVIHWALAMLVGLACALLVAITNAMMLS